MEYIEDGLSSLGNKIISKLGLSDIVICEMDSPDGDEFVSLDIKLINHNMYVYTDALAFNSVNKLTSFITEKLEEIKPYILQMNDLLTNNNISIITPRLGVGDEIVIHSSKISVLTTLCDLLTVKRAVEILNICIEHLNSIQKLLNRYDEFVISEIITTVKYNNSEFVVLEDSNSTEDNIILKSYSLDTCKRATEEESNAIQTKVSLLDVNLHTNNDIEF